MQPRGSRCWFAECDSGGDVDTRRAWGRCKGSSDAPRGVKDSSKASSFPAEPGSRSLFPAEKQRAQQGSGTASCQLPTSLKSGENWVKCMDQCSSKMFTQKTCLRRPLPRASGVDFRAPRNPGCNLMRSKSQASLSGTRNSSQFWEDCRSPALKRGFPLSALAFPPQTERISRPRAQGA